MTQKVINEYNEDSKWIYVLQIIIDHVSDLGAGSVCRPMQQLLTSTH